MSYLVENPEDRFSRDEARIIVCEVCWDVLGVTDPYASHIFEPPHDKTSKMACAPSEDSDRPGHPPSLISLRCPHEESLDP